MANIITGIRIICNLLPAYVLRKEIVVLHTVMNRVTGILLFMLPLTLSFIALNYSGSTACAVATFAAIQEGHLIRTGAEKKAP